MCTKGGKINLFTQSQHWEMALHHTDVVCTQVRVCVRVCVSTSVEFHTCMEEKNDSHECDLFTLPSNTARIL